MTDERYRVRVTKDHLVFSAAHFITFNGNICERLHGHNWRVAVEVAGPLDENSYVFDFIALRDATQKLVHELDHRVLLPTQHPTIHVQADDREVTATFEARRWIFPREDCVLLPLQLRDLIRNHSAHKLNSLRVEIEENFGQWAMCEMPVTST